MAPGIDIDTRQGQRFVRMSFAGTDTEISTALDRLGEWLG